MGCYPNVTVLNSCFSSSDLNAVVLLESLVFLPEGVDTIDHGLDKCYFGMAQSMLVGDVIGATWIEMQWVIWRS